MSFSAYFHMFEYNASNEQRMQKSECGLSVAAPKNIDYLCYFRALVLPVTTGDRVFHAVAHMVTQDLFFRTPQRRSHRGNLCDNVYTIAIFFYHARQAAHLAFNAVQSFLHGSFRIIQHD